MRVLYVDNVNDALPTGLIYLRDHGIRRDSRNGFAMVAPGPVTTVYRNPTERVIFDEKRDANPFFHLFEALWMLAGRNDLKYVRKFAKNMASYSDDGVIMWGAYGWRWRSYFGHDQLNWAIDRLTEDKTDRRAVLQMWDGAQDPAVASNGGKDVPCNLSAHFQINDVGALDMTVFNRSNDIVWGAYGANAVHFSILQEYVASSIGVGVGRYWQVSNNYHAYSDLYTKLVPEELEDWHDNPYDRGGINVLPLMNGNVRETWDQDLMMFLEDPMAVGFRNAFFRKVAKPMAAAHKAFKDGDFDAALDNINQMPEDNDWRLACWEWLTRRKERRDAEA